MDNIPLNDKPEEPFVLMEGLTKEIGLYNRVLAIQRVNYLVKQTFPNFDIYEKTDDYRYTLDQMMYERFYKDAPEARIDEEFCQRMAQICLEFEHWVPAVAIQNPNKEPTENNPWKKLIHKLRKLNERSRPA